MFETSNFEKNIIVEKNSFGKKNMFEKSQASDEKTVFEKMFSPKSRPGQPGIDRDLSHELRHGLLV